MAVCSPGLNVVKSCRHHISVVNASWGFSSPLSPLVQAGFALSSRLLVIPDVIRPALDASPTAFPPRK